MELLFGWPLAPVKGLIRLAEIIQEQVDLETRSPMAVRRRLEEVEEARLTGEISEEDAALEVERILGQVIAQPGPPV
ncbi:gas vesicle protein GvpG [Streptosporangium sp. NPDC006007]|uniref:gas vesicle protein GvpG n=1 Tax=Streptosporangium sp. NPDC006007 TaxID=3154575 RepID=UPI0033BC1749